MLPVSPSLCPIFARPADASFDRVKKDQTSPLLASHHKIGSYEHLTVDVANIKHECFFFFNNAIHRMNESLTVNVTTIVSAVVQG